MKLTEIKCGVVTQHVTSNTLLKAIGYRGSEMTLDNLIMKMNLKLGGITHALTSSAAFLSKNRLTNNIMFVSSVRIFVLKLASPFSTRVILNIV